MFPHSGINVHTAFSDNSSFSEGGFTSTT